MSKIQAAKRLEVLLDIVGFDETVQVCDIGARVMGEQVPPYHALVESGLAHLSAFEPEPEAFEQLRAQDQANTTYFPYAVGKKGPATFYSHKIGSLSSVFKFWAPAAHYLGKSFWVNRPIEEIPMTLKALDEIADFPQLDILKMDCQGAEFDILQGGRDTLSRATVIIPEVRFYRMYEDEPMWADLDTELRAQGFVLHKFMHQKKVLPGRSKRHHFVPQAASQLLDGDAVYIRNMEDPSTLSDHQVKVLAVAADCIFGSPDLVTHCIDILRDRGLVGGYAMQRYLNRLPAKLREVPEDA